MLLQGCFITLLIVSFLLKASKTQWKSSRNSLKEWMQNKGLVIKLLLIICNEWAVFYWRMQTSLYTVWCYLVCLQHILKRVPMRFHQKRDVWGLSQTQSVGGKFLGNVTCVKTHTAAFSSHQLWHWSSCQVSLSCEQHLGNIQTVTHKVTSLSNQLRKTPDTSSRRPTMFNPLIQHLT